MISEKIVVIDDDIRVIKSLQLGLSEYNIVVFQDGNVAIDFFQKPRDIYCVLLDVFMPTVNGLTVLEEIKKKNPHMAVIIMTAYGSKDVVVQALRHHADDFVEKPFKIEDIKDKVQNFLRDRVHLNKNAARSDYKVERIMSFVKRNYSQASLDVISQEMCLSSKYISRMFKEHTGVSYRDYHLDIKIGEAKKLLKKTSLSVDEISYRLGYQNPESFMRIFKRKTQVTPTEYRKT